MANNIMQDLLQAQPLYHTEMGKTIRKSVPKNLQEMHSQRTDAVVHRSRMFP